MDHTSCREPFWRSAGVLVCALDQTTHASLTASASLSGFVSIVAHLALVEVVEDLDFGVSAEELFVGTECLGRGTQSCTDALSEVDLSFNVLVADEVDEDLVRLQPTRSTRPARWMSRMIAQGKS